MQTGQTALDDCSQSPATGVPRVLIVEDEFIVALLIEDMVNDMGFEVAGVAGRVSDALQTLTDGAEIDLAILDVNICGEPVFAVAERLEAQGIPFIFATAYGRDGVPEAFRDHTVLQKPFYPRDLKHALIDAAQHHH